MSDSESNTAVLEPPTTHSRPRREASSGYPAESPGGACARTPFRD